MSDEIRETAGSTPPSKARPKRAVGKARAAEQPFEYPLKREFVEPDWTRLPGFKDVTTQQWESAQWQRSHTIKNLVELKRAFGDLLPDDLYADIELGHPQAAKIAEALAEAARHTADLVGSGDRAGFAAEFRAVADYLGPYTAQALAESDVLIRAMVDRP